MKIYVARKKSLKTGNNYLVMEARANYGTIPLSFDGKRILEILPYGIDHRAIDEKGIEIGEIKESV